MFSFYKHDAKKQYSLEETEDGEWEIFDRFSAASAPADGHPIRVKSDVGQIFRSFRQLGALPRSTRF